MKLPLVSVLSICILVVLFSTTKGSLTDDDYEDPLDQQSSVNYDFRGNEQSGSWTPAQGGRAYEAVPAPQSGSEQISGRGFEAEPLAVQSNFSPKEPEVNGRAFSARPLTTENPAASGIPSSTNDQTEEPEMTGRAFESSAAKAERKKAKARAFDMSVNRLNKAGASVFGSDIAPVAQSKPKTELTPKSGSPPTSTVVLKSKAPSVNKTLPAKGRSILKPGNPSDQVPSIPEKAIPTNIDLSDFLTCNKSECNNICGAKDPKFSRCDKKNDKICYCAVHRFVSVDTTGKILPINITDKSHMACKDACNSMDSYARIRLKADDSKNCFCLTNQKSRTGITLCDEFAVDDRCKEICQSESATCSFDGACLCRSNWVAAYNMTIPNVRKEIPSDHSECSKRCIMYHHDYVARIYDHKMLEKGPKQYAFRDKYCLCGPEEVSHAYNQTQDIIAAGFQVCTGLKCKQRCGMRDAVCEPTYRRACLCRRQNIFIGPHLWSRLPGAGERFCQDTCFAQGLHARVIERNPLLNPYAEKYSPWYRKSLYKYQYDGKFCHCIKVELDLNMFRPCTDELCRFICGHHEAVCDFGTRRDCICNTHKMLADLGRKPEPGEANCDITCRYHLLDAKVLDLKWEAQNKAGWGVKNSKFCGCVRPVSPAGLSHCDGHNDMCPIFCGNVHAYCTREKYCECGLVDDILNNSTIRLPNGKEAEECGEKCRSWMWPLAEDTERIAFIYDEARELCAASNSCPPVDTTPWMQSAQAGAIARAMDALDPDLYTKRKYCLCSKNTTIHYSPGTRLLSNLQPFRAPVDLECIGNHTCTIVDNSIHIKS